MRIKLKEFLNTPEEVHAAWIGFFEVLCPWPPRWPVIDEHDNPPHATRCTLIKEYHYYLFGRGMGLLAWIGIAKLIQVAFW